MELVFLVGWHGAVGLGFLGTEMEASSWGCEICLVVGPVGYSYVVSGLHPTDLLVGTDLTLDHASID